MSLYTLNQAETFMLHPTHTMIVVLADESRVSEVIAAVQIHGIDPQEVSVLHGQKGREILDAEGSENGMLDKFMRLLEHVSEVQRTYVKYVDEQLARGAYALSIPVTDESKQDAIAEVLKTAHAQFAVYFRKASIVDIQVPRDVAVL